jgi:hypothetical protein
MSNESNSQLIELPDRKEISLCEAVTAVIYGKAMDIRQWQCECAEAAKSFDRWRHESGLWVWASNSNQPSPKESKINVLLEKLREAAYAGRVKFRAVPEDAEDGYKDIDPLYFYVRPFFNWPGDAIYRPEDESTRPWYFVHLDREQFVSLLKDMGVSVEPNSNSDALGRSKIYKTGLQGRPSAKGLALPRARARLSVGDYPDTKKEFSKQIVEAVAKAEPEAPRMTAKALSNDIEFSELWRQRPPRPK